MFYHLLHPHDVSLLDVSRGLTLLVRVYLPVKVKLLKLLN